MNKIQVVDLERRKIEELLVFYNKYLALEYDENYLMKLIKDENYMVNLIKNISELFELKASPVGVTPSLISKYDLKCHAEELECSPLEKSMLKFYTAANIKIDDMHSVNIDRYGTIINFNDKDLRVGLKPYIGRNISDFLNEISNYDEDAMTQAKKDVRNVINQNVLISKIYQAVVAYIKIRENKGKSIMGNSVLFAKVNADIVNYENALFTKYPNYKQINDGFTRLRSRR